MENGEGFVHLHLIGLEKKGQSYIIYIYMYINYTFMYLICVMCLSMKYKKLSYILRLLIGVCSHILGKLGYMPSNRRIIPISKVTDYNPTYP